ncbi:hypothetical protein GQ57_27540 [Burkholderia sp. MSh2]|uniref:HNH nuclease domain-containing protein n=2 Tax=Burkholderiaceae TaxID=119060 RepID=A0A6P2RFR8_9BURK|nr:hypothetical protein GQ57_27540 [Burkholderia sp. MSh2]CAB3769465.1 hypothetical protein LMG30113_05968 [Burkholderia paludis]VWC35598.1 hypothetical protein BPA30113_06559 [Burkholderia paludis]
MRANVIAKNGWSDGIAEAFRQRELELFDQKVVERLQRSLDALSPIERKIIRGLAALWMTHPDRFPPNRSFQAIRNREGDLIRFAEDVVSSKLESNGYRRLKAAGFDDLVFERMVLDHPDVFSERTRSKALKRLKELDAIVAGKAEGDEDHAPNIYATKQLLEEIGFEKPQPTSWYALRGDEIAFLSWVREADFERGVARILADEGDNRPNFYHWRSQIQKIKAGGYREAYIVFGYKGPNDTNIQRNSELRLYLMGDIQEIGQEVFAAFSPVDAIAPENVAGKDRGDEAAGEEAGRSLQFTRAPIRPEQAAFRRALFERFNGQCALTGCAVAELLDAAHLPGKDWALGHNSADDGILLRTDLHRALDMSLIRLDAALRLVWVDPSVQDLYGTLLAQDHGQRGVGNA